MTGRQRWALENLSVLYYANPECGRWSDVFGRDAPLGLEIGFGMGQATLDWAMRRPDMNIVGIEIYRPGIGALLLGIEEAGLANVRVLEGNARLLLEEKFRPKSLDEVRIWFPDPWPKRRHHKRRLIQPAFVEALAHRLRPGGKLLLATDWADYASWMEKAMGQATAFSPISMQEEHLATAYENRGRRLGHKILEFAYQIKN